MHPWLSRSEVEQCEGTGPVHDEPHAAHRLVNGSYRVPPRPAPSNALPAPPSHAVRSLWIGGPMPAPDWGNLSRRTGTGRVEIGASGNAGRPDQSGKTSDRTGAPSPVHPVKPPLEAESRSSAPTIPTPITPVPRPPSPKPPPTRKSRPAPSGPSMAAQAMGAVGGAARAAALPLAALAALVTAGALIWRAVPGLLARLGNGGGAPEEHLFVLAKSGLRGRRQALLAVKEAMVKAGTPQGLNYARTDAQVAEVGIKELTARTARDFFASTHGQCAAHMAAAHGHGDVLESLQDAGADVGQADAFGRTAVHYAAASGHTEVMSMLVGMGLKLGARDKHGRCAVHYLAMQVAGGADRVVRGDWGAKADAEAGLSGLYLVSLLVPAAPLKKMCALKDKGGVSVSDMLAKAKGALAAMAKGKGRPPAGSPQAVALKDLTDKVASTLMKCG